MSTKEPYCELRMLWSWSRIDGDYRHPPYSGLRSMLDIAAMSDPENNPEMMRFLRHASAMGVNALALTHELHHMELVDYDQHGFRPYYQVLSSFGKYLEQWGIDLYLYTSATPEKYWQEEIAGVNRANSPAEPIARAWFSKMVRIDCPYDPRVREFTEGWINEIIDQVPSVKGFLVAGGLGGYAGGRLYDCKCTYCTGTTAIERVEKQINLFSTELEKSGRKLVYTLTTDHPFTMDREVEVLLDLIDRIPDNTVLTFKNCYHDFEDLRYPEHPVLSRLAEGTSPAGGGLAIEYQLFPEHRGKGSILTSAAEKWSEIFRMSAKRGIRGAIGVIETHPGDSHPNMSDWYCLGRLMNDPFAEPAVMLKEWALSQVSTDVADVLVEILLLSYKAAGKILYAGGVQCGIHGMIIPYPHFVCDIMNDTWCAKDKRQPFGLIGNKDRINGIYSPEREAEIRADETMFLFLNALPADEELKQKVLAEKAEGIALYEKMYAMWQAVESDAPIYKRLLSMLEQNCNDAKRFYVYQSLFLDWQAGTLTVAEIEEARKAHIGTGVVCSIHTCDENLDGFLTRLRYRLEGIPFEEHFDCMYDLPLFKEKVEWLCY